VSASSSDLAAEIRGDFLGVVPAEVDFLLREEEEVFLLRVAEDFL
jgi:hypothetical protein